MKNIVLFLFLASILISCSKNDDQTNPEYLIQDLNATVLKPTSFNPPNNVMDTIIDIDGDLLWDFEISVILYKESFSPHSEYTKFFYSEIRGRDSTCQIVVDAKKQAEIAHFQAGEDVNGDSLFYMNADIAESDPFSSGTPVYGDLVVGIRKKTLDQYRYGYIELNAQWGQIILNKSVYNKNQNHCKIEGQ